MATAKSTPAIKTPTSTGLPNANPPASGTTTSPPNSGSTAPPVGTGIDASLTGADRDAYVALTTLFTSYGLGSLAPKIYDYIKNGYSADTISILLQQTDEYKQRFAGNEARKKAGLPVLSPADYLNTEAAYRQIMQSAGLPAGFYDSPNDFTTWIGKNVSPTEIQSRVDLASQATTLASPQYKQALNQMGISDSQLTAYFLDPEKALPSLQKSAATATIGAAALQQGLTFDVSYAGQLATSGISGSQAQQGYSQIAQDLNKYQALSSIYGGGPYTQRTSEEAIFSGNAAAIAQQQRLRNSELANFGGAVGGAANALDNPTSAR